LDAAVLLKLNFIRPNSEKILFILNKNIMETLTETQKQTVLDTQLTIKVALVGHICKIMEAATSRGVFKAEELTYVGNVYDGLAKAIQDVTKSVLDKPLETVVEEPSVGDKETATIVEEVEVEGEEEK
jgi:hypothetical protein